jgi:hypothetical protein
MIGEFLLELSQRGLRACVKTFHDAVGFVLDQAAHRQGKRNFPVPVSEALSERARSTAKIACSI